MKSVALFAFVALLLPACSPPGLNKTQKTEVHDIATDVASDAGADSSVLDDHEDRIAALEEKLGM